jgi:transcriptional regulator GlxA family with amidase domain
MRLGMPYDMQDHRDEAISVRDSMIHRSTAHPRHAPSVAEMSRLLEAGAQVTEVGHEVGFTSPAAFSRTFAAFLGEPPTAWRRRHAATR